MAEDLIARSRWEGARRRALRHGLPVPDEPEVPSASRAAAFAEKVGTLGALGALAATVPWTLPDRSADGQPADGQPADGQPADAAPPGASGEAGASFDASRAAADTPAAPARWFDRRAFAFGWLAMIIALAIFQSALLTSVAGLVTAYALARQRKLLNAVVSVVGAYVGGAVLGIAMVVFALIFAR